MQLAFYFDQTRCIGCYTCTVACKNWHDIPAGPANWQCDYNSGLPCAWGAIPALRALADGRAALLLEALQLADEEHGPDPETEYARSAAYAILGAANYLARFDGASTIRRYPGDSPIFLSSMSTMMCGSSSGAPSRILIRGGSRSTIVPSVALMRLVEPAL